MFCVRGIFLLLFFVTICSANESDVYFDVPCNDGRDCYVLPSIGQGLYLDCYHNVHKCKCQLSFMSDFQMKWENGQCLMSKYGPCGSKGKLVVGCQDGFICVDNRCPIDSSTESVKVTPYAFPESTCFRDGCMFDRARPLARLHCNSNSNQCECVKVYDRNDRTSWDMRNYDGNNNCSVGKYGPCGTKNGITLGCHVDLITCVGGMCLNDDVTLFNNCYLT